MLALLLALSACRSPATCEPSSLLCSGGRLVESCHDDDGSFFRIDGTNIIYCDSFTDCNAAQRAAESLCESEDPEETGTTDSGDTDTGSESESGPESETESESEADTSAAPVSDADGDGFTLEQGDCYDQNPHVHPGQLTFFSAHRGDGVWDYNCDLVQEKRYQLTAYCDSGCRLNFPATNAPSHGVHWSGGIPACGQPGSAINRCEIVVDRCEPVVRTVVQACR